MDDLTAAVLRIEPPNLTIDDLIGTGDTLTVEEVEPGVHMLRIVATFAGREPTISEPLFDLREFEEGTN
jgi:hypothetical protein